MTAAVDARPCRLYRVYVWDPRTNYSTKTLGYIGETVRLPIARLLEHIACQPWADTFAGYDVDEKIYYGKTAVQTAEEAAVKAEKPLYNYEFNLDNPHRITIPQARKQAEERRRAGVAGGRPDPHRPTVTAPSVSRRTANRSAPQRRLRAARREPDYDLPPFVFRWLGYAAMWLVLAGAVWWAVAPKTSSAGGAETGAITATVAFMIVLLGRKKRRRKGMRRR